MSSPTASVLLRALRRVSESLAGCPHVDALPTTVLTSMAEHAGLPHAAVLLLDAQTQLLRTVARSGDVAFAVGDEMPHQSSSPLAQQPGQLAAPLVSANRVLGWLFAESREGPAFGPEHEDLLATVAAHLAAALDRAEQTGAVACSPAVGPALLLRRYRANNSVFVGDTYLIKGVAGVVFWKLLSDYQASGRTEFSNRELRLDDTLGLPDGSHNLEARLVLLQRRLDEHSPQVFLEKVGRGRMRLVVRQPIELLVVE